MKATHNPRKKKLLAFLLSTMMLTSTAFGFVACGDNASSSSSSTEDSTTEEYVDNGILKNAGFENFDDNEGLNPIATSPTGWSLDRDKDSSGTATVSSSASGILDTATSKWDTLTSSYVADAYSSFSEAEIANKWKDMSTRDKLDYYKAWKADSANNNRKITDLSFYQSFNIDDEDLPLVKDAEGKYVGVANPRTHDYTAESETNKDYDSKILMLHNNVDKSNYVGTANKATSSSTVTVKAGTASKLSLWVKTAHLQANVPAGSNNTTLVDLGAYIQISHSVGGTALDPIEIKNIDTDGVTANNGWVQYAFYLQGSYYVDTTYTVVLGLGHGGNQDRLEYVNGYAFFDDIECETIERSEYATLASDAKVYQKLDINATKTVFSADELGADKNAIALDLYGQDGDFLNITQLDDPTAWTIKPTEENNVHGQTFTAITKFGLDPTNDKCAIVGSVQDLNGANANAYEKAVYEKTFKDKTFLASEKALVLLSVDGVSYTANSPAFSVPAGERQLLSFFVKTSAMEGLTGATVTLNDGTNKISFSAMDTTTITATSVGDKEIYDGWQQCLFFIHNETENDKTFTLTFNYGLTNVISTTADGYGAGFAVFSGFKTKVLSKQEFAFASDSSYAKTVTLTDDDTTAGAGDSGFDSATKLESANIENGFAMPQNYTGVYSDSMLVNSDNTSKDTNNYAGKAGLLNKEYADNYAAILTEMQATGATGAEQWASVFPYATQPLVIVNDTTATKSYGYIGETTSIGANAYKAVSLYVKTTAGTKAGIYLVDMSDDTHTGLLSIGRNRTYWYDKNGNVCDTDPTAKTFDKNVNVAFNLQANGLYTVDSDWAKKGDIQPTTYYANLANYEVKDGNLVVADGGISRDYSNVWQHEGNDGIAFYGYDATAKTAYADKAKTILVHDFSKVTDLPVRYEEKSATASNYFEIDTNGELVEVNFFIHTGSVAKSYRLEVWNGTRDGQTVNTANGYVYFDINGYTIDETKFASNTETYKADLTEDKYFENAFSFYDSATYLRYNASLDENKVGNVYSDYDATSTTAYATHKPSIAYMRYENVADNRYEIYTDYAMTDTTVTANVEDTEEDTTEEDDTASTETLNPWLLASSIVVALALVVAVVLIIVRKSISAYRKKHGIYKK